MTSRGYWWRHWPVQVCLWWRQTATGDVTDLYWCTWWRHSGNGDVTDQYVCTMTSQRCWWRQLHLRPPGNRRLPSLQCRGASWTGEISDVHETVFARPKPRPEDNNTGNRRKDESCPCCWTKDVQSTRTTPSWAGHVVAEPHRCHGNELSQQHQHYDNINDAGYFRC